MFNNWKSRYSFSNKNKPRQSVKITGIFNPNSSKDGNIEVKSGFKKNDITEEEENLINKFTEIVSPQKMPSNELVNFQKNEKTDLYDFNSSPLTWSQRCASKYTFISVFCVSSILQGMFYTYFVSTLNTLERLYHIPSRVTGTILSTTMIGHTIGAILLSYYGSQGHRPRWMGLGLMVFAVSCILLAFPHFIEIEDESLHQSSPNINMESYLCFLRVSPRKEDNSTFKINFDFRNENDLAEYYYNDPDHQFYDDNIIPFEEHCQSKLSHFNNWKHYGILLLLFANLLGIGIGSSAINTLGVPYIDDNIPEKQSPLYFAVTTGTKILGPVLGFYLGSFCLKLYYRLFEAPQILPNDSNWIGCWWLGFVVIGIFAMTMSIVMFFFPSALHQNKKHEIAKEKHSYPKLKDFPKRIRYLLCNNFLMFRITSSVLHIIPIAGFYTFLPKYLESQFTITSYLSNIIAGTAGMLVMGIGVMSSGVFIKKIFPTPRTVAFWTVIASISSSAGMGILMFVDCSENRSVAMKNIMENKSLEPICNSNCSCADNFYPICGADGLTYYSPCQAACHTNLFLNTTVESEDDNPYTFTDCDCIPGTGRAAIGTCMQACKNFYWYIAVFSISVFMHSTIEVGSMMLTLRCVHSKDKAIALALDTTAVGLFGSAPCGILFGSMVDYACILWDSICDSRGACRIYDNRLFRLVFHGNLCCIFFSQPKNFPGLSMSILLLAALVDLIIWKKSKRIVFEKSNEKKLSALQDSDSQVFVDTR